MTKLSTNLGYVYENVIAQMLANRGKQLFYHTIPFADGKKYYEVDFLISDGHKVSPIEVKSRLQIACIVGCLFAINSPTELKINISSIPKT